MVMQGVVGGKWWIGDAWHWDLAVTFIGFLGNSENGNLASFSHFHTGIHC